MTKQQAVWGIVVAGGSGARFGGRKQLARLGDRRVIDYSLEVLRPFVSGIVAVLPADLVDGTVAEEPIGADRLVAGAATRSASVRVGLAALPDSVDAVLVHDAARPLASAELVARVLAALDDASAVVPVVPVTDTLRTRTGRPVDREQYVAVQTPQGFDLSVLTEAHAASSDASDDASLVDALGGVVVHVEGDPRNMKITVPHDLELAEVLLHDH